MQCGQSGPCRTAQSPESGPRAASGILRQPGSERVAADLPEAADERTASVVAYHMYPVDSEVRRSDPSTAPVRCRAVRPLDRMLATATRHQSPLVREQAEAVAEGIYAAGQAAPIPRLTILDASAQPGDLSSRACEILNREIKVNGVQCRANDRPSIAAGKGIEPSSRKSR